ncbi:Transposase [Theobroma cacao]|nr:Transposase [Theobroma cacao]
MQRSGETVECEMPLSNENTTVEDINVKLEGDTATLEYNTTFDEGNEDLFTIDEDIFDHTSDDGLEQSQDDSSDDDCLYDNDIRICNNVEGETEPCDDPIYNNPIAGENGIHSLDTLLNDSDQERGNARISCTWVIAGAERFSFQTITVEDCLYKGRMFSSKAELKRALNMLVIKEKFTIRVKRSCKARYEVGCKDKACKFSVRSTKLPDRGEYWKVQTFHKVHTCTVDGLQGRFPTTSAKMIGELMSHKIRANGVALRPKDIICEMRVQWRLECLLGKRRSIRKAWQVNEYTERLVFGPPEESFQLLPSDLIRPTIAIDVTHLKGKFKGVLFIAVCKDANECVYPVAFSIGHVEDEDSWTWFLSKLRNAIGCFENTMFISDQYLGIKKAIQNAYPEAHHGLCGYHLKKNFKNKFKRDDVCMLFTLARDCYKVADFNRHMNQILQIHLGAHADLMRIGPEKWARACSPAMQYQMMTSNIAECVNSCLKHARQMFITVLIEFIRDMFQRWFHERYEEAIKVTTPLSPWVARQLSKRFNDAHRILVKPINRVEFEVKDGKMDELVNLSRKTCSCCEFQTDLLPCSHTIVIEFLVFFNKCNREAIEFCADYYKTTIFVEGYSGSIRPVGHPSEWDIPPHVKQIIVLPPP